MPLSVRVVILYRRRHRREAQRSSCAPYVHGCAEEAFPQLVRILYVVSELTFTVFCALVFYYSLGMLENMIRFKQVSAALEINVMYAYLIIPISMASPSFGRFRACAAISGTTRLSSKAGRTNPCCSSYPSSSSCCLACPCLG